MKRIINYILVGFPALLAVLLLALLIPSNLKAQNFTAGVSKNRVAVNEPFQIEFTIANGGADNFKPPVAFKDFDIYSGPNHSSSVQIVNGSMTQSTSISYVIASKKEGKFIIGPASITFNGSKKESNNVTVEVIKSGAGNPGNPASGANNQGATPGSPSGASTTDDNLFAKTSVNKTKVYLGEPITVIHTIYTKLNLIGFQDCKLPSYNGFWSQDAPQKAQVRATENIDGVNYYVVELKRSFIFPQRTGSLEIEPLEAACVIRQRTKQQQSIWDPFFGNGGYQDVVMKVKSKTVKVEVLPLPELNKPEDFSGAVGNFTFKASLNKSKVKTNEAMNLSISISGSGNIKLIDALKVNIPGDIERYDPKVNDNVAVNATGVSGTKSFEYVLIPRHAGDFKIDPIHFSYFNPEKKSYSTISSAEFSITVEKGKEDDNSSSALMNGIEKKDVAMVGNDIRYIKVNNLNLKKSTEGFFGSAGFYFLLGFPLIAFFVFLFARRKYKNDVSDPILLRSRKANKMAKKRLRIAEKHLEENKKEQFYEEIFKGLYGYLSDRLTIPFADLTKDSIQFMLKSRNVSDEACAQLMLVLNNCEYARYAPSAVSSDLNSVYADAANVITQIENQIS